jgi:hypothetical protein
MDAWASLFGLGVAGEGEAMYLSGTSEVIALISAARTGEPGVVTFPDWRGITLHAGPTQAGGASLDWACRLLGRTPGDLSALAASAAITPRSPIFLPHLEGERAPLWDAASRGAFAGLSSATDPAALAASVMEGVAFSARLALEAVERSGARRVTRLSLGGGGAASATWNAIRADALGRTLVPMPRRSPAPPGRSPWRAWPLASSPTSPPRRARSPWPGPTSSPTPRAPPWPRSGSRGTARSTLRSGPSTTAWPEGLSHRRQHEVVLHVVEAAVAASGSSVQRNSASRLSFTPKTACDRMYGSSGAKMWVTSVSNAFAAMMSCRCAGR